MLRHRLLGLGLAALWSVSSWSVSAAPAAEVGRVTAVTPVFSQLVRHSMPSNFTPVAENTNAGSYALELVPQGQTAEKWTEMITLTGAKGAAAIPNLTPKAFADRIAGGFQQACPDSFAAYGLGETKVDGHDAFLAVIGCGTAGPAHSEEMLLVAIKGQADVYTVQWAERGALSKQPIAFDAAKWTARMKALAPVGLCPIVPGEKPPYPSCTQRK